MGEIVDAGKYPDLSRLVVSILDQWPKHERYLQTNFRERDEELLVHSEKLAAMVIKLSSTVDGGLSSLASDYRFISEKIVLPEELHFRRHDEYRLKTFEEALRTVYSNTEFMRRYMHGLLVTDVIWINHCRCMKHYVERFLPSLSEGSKLLEIGPGHGLLLCLATEQARVAEINAWDIADASLELSRHSLEILAPGKEVHFRLRDLFDDAEKSDDDKFDGIVFSEVLEHMEDPARALRVLHRVCKPGGKVWINVPANSPAPDHLYLVRNPKQAADLLESVGFEIVETDNFPMSGTTFEKALAQKLTMNCVVIAEKPHNSAQGG